MRPYGEKRSIIRNIGTWLPRIKQWKKLDKTSRMEWKPEDKKVQKNRARREGKIVD